MWVRRLGTINDGGVDPLWTTSDQFTPCALFAKNLYLTSHSTGRTTNEPGTSRTSAQAPHFRSSGGDGGFRRLNICTL